MTTPDSSWTLTRDGPRFERQWTRGNLLAWEEYVDAGETRWNVLVTGQNGECFDPDIAHATGPYLDSAVMNLLVWITCAIKTHSKALESAQRIKERFEGKP